MLGNQVARVFSQFMLRVSQGERNASPGHSSIFAYVPPVGRSFRLGHLVSYRSPVGCADRHVRLLVLVDACRLRDPVDAYRVLDLAAAFCRRPWEISFSGY